MVKVSVIVPARNEEEYIASCLDSLMNQTKKPFEVIVVTNNSTDRTKEIVDRYRKKGVKQIIFNGKSSAAIARNMGAETAKGDVLFFLDADMEGSPGLIEEIQKVFSDGKVMHAVPPVRANANTFVQRCFDAKMAYIRHRRVIEKSENRGVTVMRRSLFKKLGGYSRDVFYFEDRVLWDDVEKYKQGIIKSLVYHNEPGTFNEFLRQSRYMGKGLATYQLGKLLKDNPSLGIAVYSFLLVLIAAVLLLLLSPDKLESLQFVILILFAGVMVYGFVRAVVYSIYSSMPVESFGWVFILMPIRLFYAGKEYIKSKLSL